MVLHTSTIAHSIVAHRPLVVKGSRTPDPQIVALVDADPADLLVLAALPACLLDTARVLAVISWAHLRLLR